MKQHGSHISAEYQDRGYDSAMSKRTELGQVVLLGAAPARTELNVTKPRSEVTATHTFEMWLLLLATQL